MLQVIQNYRTGKLELQEVPAPMLKSGGAIVEAAYSLVSVGTERSTIEISKKSMLGKAKERPDLVRKVVDTSKRIGFKNTVSLVLNRLNTPVPLGYSLSGVVKAVSPGVEGISVGDLVACAGAGYACHAEQVFVPKNLMVRIPSGVSLQEAAFGTVGSIALHGVRQANVGLGDHVGVIGLGLVGQLTVGLLRAHGCKVFAIDLRKHAVDLALEMGADTALCRDAEDLKSAITQTTEGIGLDAVIVTAGTSSNDPFLLSAEMLRDRGTLVVVGGIRMEVVKSVSSDFYAKEIDIKFSRSYGPGRYDPQYEEGGGLYPVGYVKWTETRNLQCFLELVGSKRISVAPLVTDVFPFEKAATAYDMIQESTKPYVGVLFEYEHRPEAKERRIVVATGQRAVSGKVAVGMIGAGNFAQANILPYLKRNRDVVLRGICTSRGMTAKNVGAKFGFEYCTTDPTEILDDTDTEILVVATRHDSHAEYVLQALKRRKHVYVEKPLCVNREELLKLRTAYESMNEREAPQVMVGYNRRYAPLSQKLKGFFAQTNSRITVVYRVNAGPIPMDNWYQDPAQGGRFVGEGCHFVDYGMFLTDSDPVKVKVTAVPCSDRSSKLNDNLTVTMEMMNGAVVTVVYNASGSDRMPKERVEVFGGGRSAVLDDFRSLTLYSEKGKRRVTGGQDKGHRYEIDAYVNSLREGGSPPITFVELLKVSCTTFAAIESLETDRPVEVDL